MRIILRPFLFLVFGVVAWSIAAEEPKALETEKAKLSYAIGYEVGASVIQQSQGLELDTELFLQAMRDALEGTTPRLDQEARNQVRQQVSERMLRDANKIREQQGVENLEAAKAFLEENGRRDGVVTLESGLQYKVLETGDGQNPTADDTVSVHYRGTLIDGTVFDSSYDRGNPASFKLSAVIAAWTEALQMMNVGSKWMLYVPPELGYGAQGAGQVIGPNAALIFEVELLGIEEE